MVSMTEVKNRAGGCLPQPPSDRSSGRASEVGALDPATSKSPTNSKNSRIVSYETVIQSPRFMKLSKLFN
jgi:hypothetical protein